MDLAAGVTERKCAESAVPTIEERLAAEAAALDALNRATAQLWQAHELSDGLAIMLDATIRLLGADMGNVQLLDESRGVLRIAVHRGFEQEFLTFFREVSVQDDSAYARALRGGGRTLIEDVEVDPAFAPYLHIARSAGYRSVQSTPLVGASGRVIGMISTHWRSPRRLDVQESRRLDLFARQATAFVERCRMERDLNERKERLRAVLDTAADAIITITDRGVMLDVNRAAERIFGYRADELVGKNVSMLMPSPYREEHESYLSRYRETRVPHIIGRGRELRGRRRDGSVFPLSLAVSEVDHLSIFTGVVRDLSERQDLQQKLLDAASEEQRRIGQELHDGVQQELTGLSLFAASLNDLLNRPQLVDGELERLRQMIGRLTRGLNQVHRQVQELARGILPVQIDARGLEAALQDLAAQTSADSGVTCSFSGTCVPTTSNAAATHLYRIAQEAISNALKHAKATQIDVSLAAEAGGVALEIRDNGQGFDMQAVRASTRGMGLKAMEYRAGVIGAAFYVDSQPAVGTRIRCVLPT